MSIMENPKINEPLRIILKGEKKGSVAVCDGLFNGENYINSHNKQVIPNEKIERWQHTYPQRSEYEKDNGWW